jgi:hypothetical protein
MQPDRRVRDHVRYSPRDDATAEMEAAALSACYRIILESAKNRGLIPRAPRPLAKRSGAPDLTRSVLHADKRP